VRQTPMRSKLACGLGLMLLTVGCSSRIPPSPYRVTMPQVRVRVYECPTLGPGEQCAAVRLRELRELVIELKSACIALGGDREKCQIPKGVGE